MDGDHQDTIYVARRDGRRRPNSSQAIGAKGSEELLGGRTIMTELFRVLTNEVPALQVEAPDLVEHRLRIDGLEILFFGGVGRRGEAHLPFDDRDGAITQANFVTGIDNGSAADGCRVAQPPRRNIRSVSNGGVVDAGGVAQERLEPAGGVVAAAGVAEERTDPTGGVRAAGGVALERIESAGGVVEAGGFAEERIEPAGGVVAAAGVAEERTGPAGGVGAAGGVAEERIEPAGGVVVAGGVAQERTDPDSGVAVGDDDAWQREIGCASPGRDQGRCRGDSRHWQRHLSRDDSRHRTNK